MATYVYREDCGEGTQRFEADSDEAAEDYAMATFRVEGDCDFDGDSARLFRVDDDGEGGTFEAGVCSFASTDGSDRNMQELAYRMGWDA